jgi:galactokinase
MIGGGFGGSAIALISAQDSVAISTAIKKAFAEADFTQPRFFTSLPSAGASVIQRAEL